MKDLKIVFYILFLFCFSNLLDAQSESAIRNSLGTKLQIEQPELITWTTTSSHYDPISDLTHIYARQTYNGLPIVGSESDFHINGKNGVVASNVLFKENYALKMSPNFSIMKEMEHTELLHNIVDQLELPRQKLQINVVSQNLNNKTSILRAEGIANGDIPFKGVLFYEKNNQLQYGYLVKIDVSSSPDWWEILVNAKNGNIISKVNYTISCAPEGLDNIDRKKRKLSVSATHSPSHSHADIENAHAIMVNAQDCYLVYPSPLESPYNGPQSMTTDPANNTASPFGWHDTNGTIGHEFTITRGNNVWAKEDLNGDNEGTIGFSPDGGANLVFNFPIDLLIEPSQYQAGAITNLFYWNNLIHDVMHFYGFDEASGNFQQTNYSGQGTGGDYVNADAQNSGNCNANFATPPDGSRPRMQMFTCSNAVPKRDSDLD
ncbi:MAG: M36 family metallopeptidase, partial [Saprospiraceae bacterium]